MKKRIVAVVALMILIVLESITAFATESPNSSNIGATLSGDVVMVSGDDSYFYIYRLTSVDGNTAESRNASIGIQAVSDETFVTLTDSTYSLVRNKMFALKDEAEAQGKNIDGIAFDVTANQAITSVRFIDGRIEASDKDNGLVRVFHQKEDGTWEEPEFLTYDGEVIVSFESGLSPVMIVKYTNKTDYSSKPTISGNVTSPKTNEGTTYVVIVAIVALIGVVIFARKYANR